MTLIRKYDPVTAREYVGTLTSDDTDSIARSDAFRMARKQIVAQEALRNARQNIGRAFYYRTNTATTLVNNGYQVPPFNDFNTIPSTLRMWRRETNPLSGLGYAFICEEPGWYNIKGGITVKISLAAVPATFVTQADAELIYSPASRAFYSIFWQNTAYAPVRVVPGTPPTTEQLYMRGWSHTFAEKLWLGCGDALWLHHGHQGAADINYLETYIARLAIQKTGDAFIQEECC